MKNIYLFPVVAAGLFLAACENGNNDFPDFDYQTVYFANQYVERTVELGEEEFVDVSDDNDHVVNINATWGGGYTNRNNVLIDYVIDNSLVDGLYFKDTDDKLEIMPSNYYSLPDTKKINIKAGQIMGGIRVQLNDAFFNDPKSIKNCYVIPVRMTAVEGADSILSGVAYQSDALLTDAEQWATQPKNFVLYAVKYVNPWHGQYLRRGADVISIDGKSDKVIRHEAYVENDEVVDITTSAFKQDILPITVKDADGNNITFDLVLNFSDDNSCSLAANADNISVSGNGKFVSKGDKNSLGGKDRDVIYLDYQVSLNDKNMKIATNDTLVLHTRNVYGGATLNVERK